MKKFLILFIVASLVYACSSDDSSNPEDEINILDNRQSTGSSANDILSDSEFKSIIVELVYVEGFEPTQAAVDNFVFFLNSRVNKPDGISVEKRSIASPLQEAFEIEEIAQIERDERIYYNQGDQLAIWAYFSDGKSANDEGNSFVLGTAYWNTSFVIYQETLENLSNSPTEPNRSLLETTVINHEIGHLFGLTNSGTPMLTDHEDDENPKHCNVESCLMFWASESNAAVGNIMGMGSAPNLDPLCIADLQANGGK